MWFSERRDGMESHETAVTRIRGRVEYIRRNVAEEELS